MCITVFVLPALYYSFLPSLFFNGNNKNYCNESRQNLKPFDVKYKSYRNLKIALEEGFVAGIDEFYSENRFGGQRSLLIILKKIDPSLSRFIL